MNREQFIEQVISVTKDKFPAATISRAEEPFALLINGQLAPLENLYRSANLQPDHSTTFIEQWVLEMIRASEGTPDLNASFEELSERIMPVVLRETKVADQASPMLV